MGNIGFAHGEGKSYVLGGFAFEETKVQILLQVQPLKI